MMQALAGLKVVDFSKWLPGQYAGMLLGDFGADVLKVEDVAGDGTRTFTPQREEGMSYWHLALNRNKRGLALNIKTEAGRQIMQRLLSEADVFLEGFRPGYLASKGLGYEDAKRLNPRLIYCSITGFGQSGKYKNLPAHDMNVIGLAGLSYKDAETGGATITDVQMAAIGGAYSAVSGILLALLAREKSGQGQQVDIALFNAAVAEQLTAISAVWGCEERGGKPFGRAMHYYNIYETKDKRFLSCGAMEPKFYAKVCALIGREDLIPRQYEFQHKAEFMEIFAAAFRQKTLAEWLTLIGDEQYCVTPVLSLKEVLAGDMVAEADLVSTKVDEELGAIRYLANPIRLSLTPQQVARRAPRLGEHTAEVLLEMGYSEEEVEKLKEEGVVK